jgi:hypothetical protein
VEAPSGARERFPAGETAVQLSESGFHEVRPIGRSGATPVPVALNVAPAESDLSVLDVQEFVSSVSSESTGSVGVELVGPASSADLEQRQRLWWFLMVGALAVLLGETLVSNRLSRAVR